MSRKITFRGMDSMTGNWVYGNLVILGTGSKYIIPQNFIGNEIPQWLVDRDTVGQFTGLKDNGGREIYEGDLIKVSGHPFEGSISIDGIYEVKYNNLMELCAGSWLLHRLLYCSEVIGNIYENPELLEGEK